MCAENTRNSSRSLGSLPSTMPITLGALSESVMVSFRTTVAVSPGSSRSTGPADLLTSARFTRAARNTGATTASLTSTDGGELSRRSIP
jgi:hypothetical protein